MLHATLLRRSTSRDPGSIWRVDGGVPGAPNTTDPQSCSQPQPVALSPVRARRLPEGRGTHPGAGPDCAMASHAPSSSAHVRRGSRAAAAEMAPMMRGAAQALRGAPTRSACTGGVRRRRWRVDGGWRRGRDPIRNTPHFWLCPSYLSSPPACVALLAWGRNTRGGWTEKLGPTPPQPVGFAFFVSSPSA